MTITQAEAHTLYTEGNNAGRGYAPYTDVPGADTMESAVAAFEADGWEVVIDRNSDAEVIVLRNGDGELVALGDANGPWAVEITPAE